MNLSNTNLCQLREGRYRVLVGYVHLKDKSGTNYLWAHGQDRVNACLILHLSHITLYV